MIEHRIALADEILDAHSRELGNAYPGYRNHVYRMIHYCFARQTLSDEERTKVVIAGCFHDLGIWTASTFDYLPPSIDVAGAYLARNGLERWFPEIELMIGEHHKLTSYTRDPLVDTFRKGDLVDLSLGLVKCGVPAPYIREVKAAFPNAGFHAQLARVAVRWICSHPLNPVPVLKF